MIAPLKKPDWMIEEPDSVYHAKARENLSSHQLADFRRCPKLYKRKRDGLITAKDSTAYAFGRAAHTLILEGLDAFEDRYAIGGPINSKTGKPFGSETKAYAIWFEESGKEATVTNEEEAKLDLMKKSVFSHPRAATLIHGGFAEGVVRTEYFGHPSQIRMDYYHPLLGLVDLKTCDDLTWFESDARRYGYLYQMAFYHAVLRVASKLDVPVHIIAVEKKEPYRCGVWEISIESLDFARAENERAMETLRYCQLANRWPTGYEEVRIYDAVQSR